jgi:hypothetical protein
MARGPEKHWFVRDRIAGQPRQVWLFDGQAATRIGVTNPEGGAGTYFRAEPGEDFWDCIRRQTAWLNPEATEGRFHSMNLGPAEYYPRIGRPNALGIRDQLWSPSLKSEEVYIRRARRQLTLLAHKLEIICQTVDPAEKTLDVYGHEIRNLLILAATEAEMHWRGILVANGSLAQRLNSNEYVKLVEPLKLLDYAVTFQDFPELQPIQPFAGWSKVDPTKSLAWYDAYHGVKHNRDTEFQRGTLRHAFEAVSACIALLVAQFGPVSLNTELSTLIGLTVPDWPIGEMYLPEVTTDKYSPIKHPVLSA